jgi:hypothetical protein
MLSIIPAHLLTLAFAWAVVTKVRTILVFQNARFYVGRGPLVALFTYFRCFFCFGGSCRTLFPDTENELIRILKSSRTAVLVVAFMATFTAPM